MNKYPKFPANNISTSCRKPVYGVGINDADYLVRCFVNDKSFECPFYRRWKSMLQRCYSPLHHSKRPTYKGCSVCDGWLIFSNFKAWMELQDWEGKYLDKDIIVAGNKIYSAENCLFVDLRTNSLLNSRDAARGELPQGVALSSWKNRFIAQISIDGVSTHIGTFNNTIDAETAYKKAKIDEIRRVAMLQTDKRTMIALYNRSNDIL